MKAIAGIRRALGALLVVVLLAASVSALAVPNSSTLAKKGDQYQVTASYLRVRKGASLSADQKDKIKRGTTVTFVSHKGAWWYVRYSGDKYGYVYNTYLTPKGINKTGKNYIVNTKKTGLNGRVEPKSNAKVKKTYKKGSTLKVVQFNGDWALTSDGYWVASKYLKKK